MINEILNFIRGVQRPLSVFILVGGFTLAALSPVLLGANVEDAKFACAALGPFAGLILQQWFSSRSK